MVRSVKFVIVLLVVMGPSLGDSKIVEGELDTMDVSAKTKTARTICFLCIYFFSELGLLDSILFFIRRRSFRLRSQLSKGKFIFYFTKNSNLLFQDYEVQKILLYYDSRQQWPSVYKKGLTCEEQESVLSINHRQIINLTTSFEHSGCVERRVFNPDNFTVNHTMIDCHYYRYFESYRERWWFIAISNCNSKKGLKLKYKITATNDEDSWTRHFSADQFCKLQF